MTRTRWYAHSECWLVRKPSANAPAIPVQQCHAAELCQRNETTQLKAAGIPPPFYMNNKSLETDDAKLSTLLRQSRVEPSLPPRFQDNVWRRIADAEADKPSSPATWLDSLLARVLQPRVAFATFALLVLVGISLGVREGGQLARHDAQARYLAAVAPNSLR
jgi:hypothetical protein